MNDFDERALTWDDNPLFVERSEVFAKEIRKLVPLQPEMEGFEYGCGTGLLSFNLMPYLKNITLADSSDGMLQVLRQKISKYGVSTMEVIKADLIVDEIPHKKFDIIYTALTLHHIVDVKSIFSRFNTMLKSSGYLCIADLDKEDGQFHGPGFIGHKGFLRDDMKKMFDMNGFKNIQCENCYEIVRENEKNEIQKYPIFLMTGQKQ